MRRKLAAIMAGDVVGYSRMMAVDETATYRDLRTMFDEIVGPAVERNEGRIFKQIGDGFLASFSSAHDALEAAEEIQHELGSSRFELRIGINLGDVIEDDDDTYGDGVNVAARLEAMAKPGSIFVSDAVRLSVEKTSERRFRHLGRKAAKNMPSAIDVYEIVTGPEAAVWSRMSWLRTVAVRPVLLSVAGAAAVAIASAGAVGALSSGADWVTELSFLNPISTDGRPFVAVMPFHPLNDDPSQAYFGDGLSEDLITELSRYPELAVVARNSTFALRNEAADAKTIGRTLNARYVVEGSARRQADQLRVSAQLIDTSSGAHLWAKTYDRSVADVFAVQAELSAEIVAALVPYVRRSEMAAIDAKPTQDLRAYDLVLRARSLNSHGSSGTRELTVARDLLRQAVALDPNYAEAHATLSLNLIQGAVTDTVAFASDLQAGIEQARQAVELQPDLALGYRALSYGLTISGDYAGGLEAAERAVSLNPNDPDSLAALAKAQLRFGFYEEAATNAARARELHPMAPNYYAFVEGQALYAADRLDEAANILRTCMIGGDQRANCLRIAAAVDVRRGKIDDARQAMRQLIALDPTFTIQKEAEGQRYGTLPVMHRFLADLSGALPPRTAAVVVGETGL